MDQLPTWKIAAQKTDTTEAWWHHALEMYSLFPEAVPDAIHPLLDPEWNETEVVATRSEVRDVQAWATGLPGWNPNSGGLLFKRQ